MSPCLSKSILRDVYTIYPQKNNAVPQYNQTIISMLQNRPERSPFVRTDMYDIVSLLYMSNELVEKEILKSEGENTLSVNLSHLDDQSITVLLRTYVKKFFNCTIFTNNALPLFPYNENYLNGWFTQNFSRFNDAGDQTNQEVKIFNASNKDEAIRGIIEVEESKKNEDENTELYFHGTDHSSAQKILKNGIELSKGREKGDLSHRDGFYMANDYEYSLTQYSKKPKPALLIFCLRPNNLKGFQELYLCDNRNRRDFVTVTQFFKAGRKVSVSRKLFSELERCDYIKVQLQVMVVQQMTQGKIFCRFV
ncbi:uncharacterized protein LOC124440684 isoform X1 [Xenia sp. Carnegie-2017]|uniref:uncharacterized protein LOC124440684 isoform X1 n=1 Tax=Xenia sp. Carnegie-2017 TaxID=2897299 RepID=UPI001F03A812|nr:uncharacterized protein LOC124440684 isoform X1 [Xenia sp. Carnegie-2017]XP_046847066.1 uncharacterized protein LOC124440684 isoform X1 [Xenia sp. Carnegie-2017]XP_046847075.1 uncharacterized protein LOC124440684 isoform X1 [Xenia sp. Carnegie-2017]XP_046847083.1 uncharacterized protein LOC124440684 isoform X1 [Xenia sp. Carnegie-2017]